VDWTHQKENRETMPINKYTGGGLKKLKKGELLSHVVELYGFIDLFDGVSLTETIEENKKLKDRLLNCGQEVCGERCKVAILEEENKKLKEELDESNDKTIELIDEKKKLRKENKELQEENKMVKIQRDGGREKQKRLDFAIKELKEQLKKGGQAHMKDKKAYDTNLKIRESELDEKDEENEKLKEQNRLMMVAHTKTLKRRNWDQSERDRLRKENKKHEDRVKYLEDLVGLGQIEHLEKMRDNDE